MTADRGRLVALVRRLIDADYATDAELDRDAADFEASVPHPRALGLIYFWEEEFDHEPTPDEIVDRAMRYRGIEL